MSHYKKTTGNLSSHTAFRVAAGKNRFATIPVPSHSPLVLAQCIAVNIILLLLIFKEGAGNIFLRLTENRHIQQYVVRWAWNFNWVV